MNKKQYLFLIVVLMLFPFTCFGATTGTVKINGAGNNDFIYADTVNNLVLDFTANLSDVDALKALTVINTGSAGIPTEIKKLSLWLDDGNGQFDAYDGDTKIGESDSYIFTDLNIALPKGDNRFFVTADLNRSIAASKNLYFGLQKASDNGGNGIYEAGDVGIFFSSGLVLPTSDMNVDKILTIKKSASDIFPPVVYFNNLTKNQVITTSSYLLKGVAYDQGGGSVVEVFVCIDNQCQKATNKGDSYSAWEYEWANISAGTYKVNVKATDYYGNVKESQSLSITANIVGSDIQPPAQSQRWIKLASVSAVYYLDSKQVHHAYPTQGVWESYYGKTFGFVEVISDEEMASYTLGPNVAFKYGTLMKIPSVNKVYKVGAGGAIYWIKTEDSAKNLYGANWASMVRDLPESFFSDYVEKGIIE